MELLDETDLKILRILQDDAKKTTKDIAKQLHLTASPVYERIRRLEKKGYIKHYVAILDKKKLNRPVTAICMVSLRYHNEGFIDTFEQVDFFLKIHLEGLEEYHEFVRSKLSKIHNIGVLESYFVLKEVHNTTAIDF